MRANIHIRKENEDKWSSIPRGERSELVNSLLEEDLTVTQRLQPAGKTGFDLNRTPLQDIPKTVGTNLCRVHGTPKTAHGKCLMKGCKYA